MAQLQEFNLTQLKELIEHNDDHLANNYISRNLTVARNVRATIIKEQFSNSPTLLPEMRILVIRQGWSHVMLNMIEHRIEQGDLVYLGPNGIIQFLGASDDVQALGISMSNEVLQLAIGSSIPQAFDGHLRDFHLHLQPDEVDYYDQLHELLSRYFREEGYSSQVTLHLVGAILWYVNNQWSHHEQITRESQTREQRLFTEFVQLVSQYAPQQHTIEFYASRLCLTPRYLSTIIKQVSGKSAKQWIDDALVTRIKIDLLHSDKPLATIADDMNFPNPSFFAKFFKRMTDMTPREYQNRHKQ